MATALYPVMLQKPPTDNTILSVTDKTKAN